jgi:Spy/CpxP family protein refolding chaperone
MMTVDMLKHAIPSITDAQAAQIGQIIKDGRQQSQALRDDQSLSDDDRRAKMREIMTSIRTKVRAVLTADQQAVFDKLPPPGRRPPRPPGGDGDGPPAPPPDAPPPPSGGPAS